MTDNEINNTKPSFNFPEYINVPLFLAQDERLHKKSTILASWLYTLHTSGKIIKVSNSYLCAFLIIKPRQLNYIFEELENYKYIIRVGKTSSRSIEWVYQPESRITIEEDFEASALDCTSRIASALDCTSDVPKNYPLVQSSGNSLCTPVHTYTRVDNKKNINTLSPGLNTAREKGKIIPHEIPETLYSQNDLVADKKHSDESFELFWSFYPVKKSKNMAACAWYSQRCVEKAHEIIDKLKLQIANDVQFLDGYAPNPAKYIQQELWNDEIQKRTKKTAGKEKLNHDSTDWAKNLNKRLF